MPYPARAGSEMVEVVLLTLQGVNTAFLLLHDFVPLGRLNNLAAIRREDSLGHRILVTLLGAVPAAIALMSSLRYFGEPYPGWLEMLLWITYGLLLLGVLRAWWVPYLVLPDPVRAARYKAIFAATHRFLPERNGLAPDTLHTLFHACCLATLVLVFVRERLVGSSL